MRPNILNPRKKKISLFSYILNKKKVAESAKISKSKNIAKSFSFRSKNKTTKFIEVARILLDTRKPNKRNAIKLKQKMNKKRM